MHWVERSSPRWRSGGEYLDAMGDVEDQREKRGERVVSGILGYKGEDEYERDGEGGVEDEALCLCMFITTEVM